MPSLTYRGRALGISIFFGKHLLFSDKDWLEFGVVVKNTDKFSVDSWTCPSNKVPAREPGEPQAWISVTGGLLNKPLEELKRMVFSVIHGWPGITKVMTPISYLLKSLKQFNL